jgi:hypothetical protein
MGYNEVTLASETVTEMDVQPETKVLIVDDEHAIPRLRGL